MVEYLESIEIEREKGKKKREDKNQLQQKFKGIKETCWGENSGMWFGGLVVFYFVLNIKLTQELFWELKIQPVRDAVFLWMFRRRRMSVPAQGWCSAQASWLEQGGGGSCACGLGRCISPTGVCGKGQCSAQSRPVRVPLRGRGIQ